MTDEVNLTVLKQDLQLTTSANDELLKQYLSLAQSAISREGIILKKDDKSSDMAGIFFAAYLFRKRASQTDTAMPRYLRYQLNNMLIAQKGSVAE